MNLYLRGEGGGQLLLLVLSLQSCASCSFVAVLQGELCSFEPLLGQSFSLDALLLQPLLTSGDFRVSLTEFDEFLLHILHNCNKKSSQLLKTAPIRIRLQDISL